MRGVKTQLEIRVDAALKDRSSTVLLRTTGMVLSSKTDHNNR
jgi:hypothetical protein